MRNGGSHEDQARLQAFLKANPGAVMPEPVPQPDPLPQHVPSPGNVVADSVQGAAAVANPRVVAPPAPAVMAPDAPAPWRWTAEGWPDLSHWTTAQIGWEGQRVDALVLTGHRMVLDMYMRMGQNPSEQTRATLQRAHDETAADLQALTAYRAHLTRYLGVNAVDVVASFANYGLAGDYIPDTKVTV